MRQSRAVDGGHTGQLERQSARGFRTGLRRREKGRRAQAPHCSGYGWTLIDGQLDASRYLGRHRGRKGIGCGEEARRWPWLKHWFADSAYDRTMLLDKAALLHFVVEVVRKLQDQHDFTPLRKHWVVERSFGWMMSWRRLVRDYEERIDVSEELIYDAMRSLILKRLFN